MAVNKKCCLYSTSVFFIIGLLVLIFGTAILPSLIKSLAAEAGLMKKDTEDLWGFIPGRSGVHIYQKFFFYDINNLENVILKNEKVTANEKGPFIAEENTNFININYTDNDEIVGFNLFRYFNTTDEELKNQEDTKLNILSPVIIYIY